MNRPDTAPQDEALREVREAYRDLPHVEPDAALDARVRAAVAAELAPGPAAAPVRRPRVIPFPRWRRTALPLAAAAAVLVAIGVNQLQQKAAPRLTFFATPPSRPPRSGGPTDTPLATAASPATPATLAAPAPVASASRARPPPPKFSPPIVSTPQLDVPVVQGPPAVAKARPDSDASAFAERPRQAEAASSGLAVGNVSDAAPAAGRISPSLAGLARAGPMEPAVGDEVAFDEVRQLIAQRKRAQAIARLKRWREAHANAPLPADLKELETSTGR